MRDLGFEVTGVSGDAFQKVSLPKDSPRGGLLGLEAANGLKARGMEVTVVHLAEWLMERQLDRTAAGMLQKSLEDRGLKFLLKTQTKALLGN